MEDPVAPCHGSPDGRGLGNAAVQKFNLPLDRPQVVPLAGAEIIENAHVLALCHQGFDQV
jgi:hypothetical protein